MKIIHWVRKEASGLFKTVGELAKYTEREGHEVSLRTPNEQEVIYGFNDDVFDIHAIHSQLHPKYYKDGKPKILFLHGEPDYGIMVKVSTEAIMDLAPIVDAFVAFNAEEADIWQSFKRTYIIPKGIDLEKYKPVGVEKKFDGDPSILYAEHWRAFRHPLHVFIACEKVYKENHNIRFYPFGCPKGKEQEFWLRMVRQNRYNAFCPGIFQWQLHMNGLINMSDMVVSPIYPSYGRVALEALACNRPVIAYKTNPHATYKCEPYNPQEMADAILDCWKNKPNGQRDYAEKFLDAKLMAQGAIDIYRRFI